MSTHPGSGSDVSIQTSPHSVPSPPSWLGEVTLLAHHLQRQGVFAALQEQVRFARRRFGRYDVIDFVAVLFGYAVSSERTLEAFYERLQPWASVFMALFGRERLPHRSTLSRFLAALDQAAVEALRTLFLHDLLARPLGSEEQSSGLWDRKGNHLLVFDIDGTREAARQRALPQAADRPAPGARTPACSRATANHRVCPGLLACAGSRGSRQRLCPSRGGLTLQTRSLLRARLCVPT